MLGNIKFIGELGKMDMLHEGILHRCIQQLLEKKTKVQTVQDMGEDFECLCKILRTIGRALDHDKARLWMDQYFDRIKTIMMHPDLPCRIRFMLLDVVELRENQWNPRRTHEIGPKTIQQVREEAIREYGYLPMPNSAMSSLTMNMDPFGRPMNGTISPHKSMMGDIFGPVSPPYMGSSSIGTGPGVVDDFTPSFLNSKPGKAFDPGFSGPYVGNRGKPNDRRGGHNSPRFDRYNKPTYHKEKEADNDSDDEYSHNDRSNRDSHYNNNRYNRDADQQQSNRYYNRNQQNQNLSVNYRNQENRGYQANYSPRQKSPYCNQDEERGKDNRSPADDNWRKDKVEGPRDEKPRERRAYRPGIDDMEGAPHPRANRNEQLRRDDWDKDQTEQADIRQENDRDYREPIKREARNFGSKEDLDRPSGSWANKDPFDYGHDQNTNRERNWERGRSFDDDREDSREQRDYQNGDIRDQRDQDRLERVRDQDRDFRPNRDFNRDLRGNNRDFRDGRDFRDNRNFRDFHDNRGGYNRDFDSRGGGGGGFARQPPKDNQSAVRELPPRFKRKQQQQQGQVDLFPSEISSPALDGSPPAGGQVPPQGMPPGGPPQRYRHPLLPTQRPPMPGFFPPRYPPPGGPPMRGPHPRGYPGQPQLGMPHPRFNMGGSQVMDSAREQTPGGPGHSPTQNLPKGPAKPDEISLRPARNFPTMLRPSAPSMLPKSAQNPHLGPSHLQQMTMVPDILGPAPGGPPPSMKTTNLTIKQVPAPERKDKRKVANKEELKQATDEFIKLFIETGDMEQAVNTVKNMKPPRRFMPEMISMMIVYGLERGDTDRENISQLILSMKQERVLASDLYLDGLSMVLERMSDLEQEIPLVKSNVAKFAAQAVGNNIISLGDLSEPLQNGTHYPFFLLCLQQLHKVKDKDWLTTAFIESKIELLGMLPECDRTKERMVEILEDRSLSFLFPLLRVQSDLWRQIRSDPNPGNVYKWIKDNVDASLQGDHGFIEILVTNVLKYITSESTLAEGVDPNNPDKNAMDKEKDLFEKYKGVLQRFLLDKTELQMVAIYAIQVLGYNRQFPKGMMLRMFMNMYDLEVIEEETFLKWKEEVNDEFPGKGHVLFQVHQWLTWLEQAEEEESEDDN